jgi:hypothetical protein
MDPELESWLLARIDGDGRKFGHGYQASVILVASPIGDIVVKSPHRRFPFGRIARASVRREAGIYAQLENVPGRHVAVAEREGGKLHVEAGLETLTEPLSRHPQLGAPGVAIASNERQRLNSEQIGELTRKTLTLVDAAPFDHGIRQHGVGDARKEIVDGLVYGLIANVERTPT